MKWLAGALLMVVVLLQYRLLVSPDGIREMRHLEADVGLRLLAGGGVLTRRDLDRVRDAGCDGVLVASAIHAGRIGAADVAALAGPMPRTHPPLTQSGTSDSR